MSRSRAKITLAIALGLIASLIPLVASGQVVVTKIHAVQGSGAITPMNGVTVTIEGVVVGDFQQSGGFSGFYVEEEAVDHDTDPLTSEGIFVFSSTAVAPGDQVRVVGRAGEFFDQTQLSSATVSVLGPGTTPPAAPVELPVTAQTDFERFEGMLVTFPQDLFISEFFNYDRFGEIVLTNARQFQGTHAAEPGAANAVAAANALARITLDDGSNLQNPSFNRHPDGTAFTLTNTFRGGDILEGVTGILAFAFSSYRIQPTIGAVHVEANPRPTSPDPIPGDVRVASFNVLNFFTHLDDGVNDICGPTGNLECRGADTEEEFDRQLAKLLAGILALDADILGIQEIENDIRDDDGNRVHDPILRLVEELNAIEGADTWAWAGPANHYNNYPVRNEIIYKPAAVAPVGNPVALASEAFDRTLPDEIEPVGRPPLAQTFRQNVGRGSRQPFTVVVNHFKSKSSSCGPIGDPDAGDGQGNCNLTRVAQSHALLDFIGVIEQNSSGVLAIGDFNSYAIEDPVDALKGGGLTELVQLFEGDGAYSFVFDGQLGYLDSAFATRSMLNRVKGLTTFHINADEPDLLDYDMSFKSDAQDDLYEPKPYRVSDHDPLIIGLTFGGRGKVSGP